MFWITYFNPLRIIKVILSNINAENCILFKKHAFIFYMPWHLNTIEIQHWMPWLYLVNLELLTNSSMSAMDERHRRCWCIDERRARVRITCNTCTPFASRATRDCRSLHVQHVSAVRITCNTFTLFTARALRSQHVQPVRETR